jgi:hypothetical protein
MLAAADSSIHGFACMLKLMADNRYFECLGLCIDQLMCRLLLTRLSMSEWELNCQSFWQKIATSLVIDPSNVSHDAVIVTQLWCSTTSPGSITVAPSGRKTVSSWPTDWGQFQDRRSLLPSICCRPTDRIHPHADSINVLPPQPRVGWPRRSTIRRMRSEASAADDGRLAARRRHPLLRASLVD